MALLYSYGPDGIDPAQAISIAGSEHTIQGTVSLGYSYQCNVGRHQDFPPISLLDVCGSDPIQFDTIASGGWSHHTLTCMQMLDVLSIQVKKIFQEKLEAKKSVGRSPHAIIVHPTYYRFSDAHTAYPDDYPESGIGVDQLGSDSMRFTLFHKGEQGCVDFEKPIGTDTVSQMYSSVYDTLLLLQEGIELDRKEIRNFSGKFMKKAREIQIEGFVSD